MGKKKLLGELTVDELRTEFSKSMSGSNGGVIRKKTIRESWAALLAIVGVVGAVAWGVKQWDAKADVSQVEKVQESLIEVQVQSIQSHDHLKLMIETVHPEAAKIREPRELRKARAEAIRAVAEKELFE